MILVCLKVPIVCLVINVCLTFALDRVSSSFLVISAFPVCSGVRSTQQASKLMSIIGCQG